MAQRSSTTINSEDSETRDRVIPRLAPFKFRLRHQIPDHLSIVYSFSAYESLYPKDNPTSKEEAPFVRSGEARSSSIPIVDPEATIRNRANKVPGILVSQK